VAQEFVTSKSGVDAQSIKVWGVGTVTVGDYTGGDVTGNDHVDTSVTLTLNTRKYFKENVEKIDSQESAIDMLGAIIPVGAQNMAVEVSADIWTELATTANEVTGVALDETNVTTQIRAMRTKLNVLGAPKAGRKLAIPSEVGALLAGKVSTLGSDMSATEAVKEGYIGRFAGFDVYEDDTLPFDVDTWTLIASHPRGAALGISYDELKIDAIPGQFYDSALGLINYGVKLVEPKFVVKSECTIA
jgi:hypothetical protein